MVKHSKGKSLKTRGCYPVDLQESNHEIVREWGAHRELSTETTFQVSTLLEGSFMQLFM